MFLIMNASKLELKDLLPFLDRYRKEKKTIVSTNGCFDLLHPGHISYLDKAKELGDILIVAVNSDQSIKKIKGPDKPIIPAVDRAYMLQALKSVDHCFIFEEENPLEVLEIIKPNIHVKGADWRHKELAEKETVEKHGGKIDFIEFEYNYSSSFLIDKIRKSR